ncbi:MAG: lipopolysaccharide biosynthesis protein [Candidatus Hydrothermia bacterium]
MTASTFQRLNIKSALKLFFSFSLGVWIQAVINVISIPIITYLISPAEFGKANMYSTIYSLLLTLILSGNDQAFTRFFHEIEEDKRNDLLWSSLYFPFQILVLITLILLFFNARVSTIVTGEAEHPMGILLTLSLLTGLLQVFNLTAIRMQKKGFLYSLVFVAQALFNVITTILYAITFGRSFYAVIWGQIVSNTLSFLLGFVFEHSNILPVRINKELLKKILAYSLPLLPSALLWWFQTWTSRIFLRAYSTFSELGLFSAAFRISYIMHLIYSGFQNFWIPVAFETYEKDRENTKLFVQTAEIITFSMAIFALLVIALKDVIFLVLAKEYRPASNILPLLLMSPVILAILAVTNKGINFMKKTYWFIISDGVTLLVNIGLNFIFTRELGARGAALSSALSFLVLFSIETFASMKLFPVKYPLGKLFLTLFILLACFLVNTFITIKSTAIITSLLGMLLICILNFDLLNKGVKETLRKLEGFLQKKNI